MYHESRGEAGIGLTVATLVARSERTKLPENCPHCGKGPWIFGSDYHGSYNTCMTCGYVVETVTSPMIDRNMQPEPPPKKRRRGPSHIGMRI